MDDTEVTNHEYRQFVSSALMTDSLSVLGEEEPLWRNIYPDTTVWKKDFYVSQWRPDA
jgi:sulfatase modifying factor 1